MCFDVSRRMICNVNIDIVTMTLAVSTFTRNVKYSLPVLDAILLEVNNAQLKFMLTDIMHLI